MSRYVLVTGCHDHPNRFYVESVLELWLRPGDSLVEGECHRGGPDIWAREFWDHRDGIVLPFPAAWSTWRAKGAPKAAGPIRNGEMVEFVALMREAGEEGVCLAFPVCDPWEIHCGTNDCRGRATLAGIPTFTYEVGLLQSRILETSDEARTRRSVGLPTG